NRSTNISTCWVSGPRKLLNHEHTAILVAFNTLQKLDASGQQLAASFPMLILTSAAEVTAVSKEAHRAGKRVGFVPTMGALHEGQLSLVRTARAQTDVVIASVFVNPMQFGPNEDFSKYPRNPERDAAMLSAEKTDYVFLPSVEEMYPPDAILWVTVEGLSEKLDGGSRPGHFRGV